MFSHDFNNSYGENTGAMVVLEGVWFHAREDAFTNEDQNVLREDVLKPISRLGGITYGRVTQGFEIPRPMYKQYFPPSPRSFHLDMFWCSVLIRSLSEEEQEKYVKPKVDGQ
jgi:hypothetical protein